MAVRFLIRLLAFFIIPTIAFPAQPEPLPFCSGMIEDTLPREQSAQSPINYDDILAVIEAVEEDELDGRCTSEQIEKVGYFLSILARNGTSPEDFLGCTELEQDIHTVLYDTQSFQTLSRSYSGTYSIEPAVLYGNTDALLCKSWVTKQCHSLKKFVKKHKTAIIIGAAVVVAVTVAVVVIVAVAGTAAASSAATAVGAAASGLAAGTDEKPSSPAISPRPEDPIAQGLPIETVQSIKEVLSMPEPLLLAQIIQEETASIREALTQAALMEPSIVSNELGSRSLAEQARELGSHMAHKVLDGMAELGSIAPQLLAEISDIGSRFVPVGMGLTTFDGESIDPIRNYADTVLSLHETIDDVFSTDQADFYTPESKANDMRIDFAIGILPPPGGILNGKNLSRIATGENNAILAEESGLTNPIIFENNSHHIFRNAPGHLVDTSANRNLLIDTASNPNNFIGKDKFGNNWYAQVREDGKQIWASERNGQIRNGGLNGIPKTFDPQTGLVGNGGS